MWRTDNIPNPIFNALINIPLQFILWLLKKVQSKEKSNNCAQIFMLQNANAIVWFFIFKSIIMYFLVSHKFNEIHKHIHAYRHTLRDKCTLKWHFGFQSYAIRQVKIGVLTDFEFDILTSTIFLDWWVKRCPWLKSIFASNHVSTINVKQQLN